MKKISCIYIITCTISNKYYIGKTVNFVKRKSAHKSYLKKGNHYNYHLQAAWDKYGEENFTFEILEEYSKEFLYSMENWWCNMLQAHNKNYGYNIDPTSPYIRYSSTKEQREKLSKTKKENNQIYIGNKFACGHKHTEEFKTYMSKINKKPKSEEHKKKIGKAHKGKFVSLETRKKQSEVRKGIIYKKPLPILQYDLEGHFIKEWESAKEIASFLNYSISMIRGVINQHKKFKGYVWKYKYNYTK